MESLSNESSYIGTAAKPMTIDSYDMCNSDAWKTWYVRPHSSTNGGVNKGGGYTSAYEPRTDCNKKSEK